MINANQAKLLHRSRVFNMQRGMRVLLAVLGMALSSTPGAANPAAANPVVVEEPGAVVSDHHSRLYVTGAVGVNWPIARVATGEAGSFTEFSNPGFSTEIGLGYDLKPARLELTYALDVSRLRGYNSVSNQYYEYNRGGHTAKNSAFASLYWDLLPGKRLSPYIGGGIGISSLDVRGFSEPGYDYEGYTKSLFAYQAKAGIAYAIDSKSKIYAEAVFRGTSGYNTYDGFNDWHDPSFPSWGGQVGVRLGL
jgi:opacity protein-like surface antigen